MSADDVPDRMLPYVAGAVFAAAHGDDDTAADHIGTIFGIGGYAGVFGAICAWAEAMRVWVQPGEDDMFVLDVTGPGGVDGVPAVDRTTFRMLTALLNSDRATALALFEVAATAADIATLPCIAAGVLRVVGVVANGQFHGPTGTCPCTTTTERGGG